MNKSIIVAGAGHGGLVAAYNLAKEGYSVTVYEQAERDAMGYDWKDTMVRESFEKAGLPKPDEINFEPYEVAVFNSPYSKVSVGKRGIIRNSIVYVERKWLINYLIDCCLVAGVKIEFGKGVKKALTKGKKVIGVELEDGSEVCAPLVIDACGMHSPVRRSLPVDCGIKKNFSDNETFFVHRAYYNKLHSDADEAVYNIWFFHCGRKGLDWVIQEKNEADILVGGFGGLNEVDVEIAEAQFRKKFDFIGDELKRGGCFCTIPVRKTLPLIVCDGYAAIGDCASMVEPLSGSGISLSFVGGRILAETIIAHASDNYTTACLWRYQYKYYQETGNGQIQPEIIKGMLTKLSGDDLEYLFQTRFLTDKELGSTGEKYTVKDILDKVNSVVCKPSIVPTLLSAVADIAKIKKVCAMMPETYDKIKVRQWIAEYENL